MTDYYSELAGPEAAQQARPDPLSESGRAAGYTSTAKGSFVDDPMVRARLFAKERGIPLSRYRIVNGRPVYRSDDDQEYFEEPNLAPISDPGSILTSLFGLSGPSVEATPPLVVGSATTPLLMAGPGGFAASLGLTGAAAGGGQYLKEKVGDYLTGEDQEGTGLRVAGDTLAGGLSQGIGGGMNLFANRLAPRDLPRLDQRAATDLQAKAAREGIQLTPAELTNLESMKSTQRMLTMMPASSGIFRDFYDRRAQNIAGRIQGMIDSFGAQDSGELAGRNLKGWALQGLQGAEKARKAAASPFYDKAMASGAQVDPQPVLDLIDDRLRFAKGASRTALEKARSYLFKPGTEELDTSIPGLHAAKLAIDDLIGGLEPDIAMVGQRGTKSTSFGAVTRAQEKLTELLKNASPDYAEGARRFQELSVPLDEMRNSLIGVLATTDDAKSQKALINMFNPVTSGPRAVAYARGLFERMGPESRAAFQDAKRIYLQDTWAKAAKEFKSAAQSPNSTAGAGWRAALLGDRRQKELLQSAFSKDEFDGISNLGEVLEATNRVRLTGSETAWNAETLKQAKEGATPALLRIVSDLNPRTFLRSFNETMTNYFFENKMAKMANIYTSPDAMKLMKELRTQKPGTQKFIVGLAQLAGEFGEDFVSDMLATSSDTVLAPGQTPEPSFYDELGSPPQVSNAIPMLPGSAPMRAAPPGLPVQYPSSS